ncbi:MAG: FkbM family methyltransferase [Clostridia bacterium]|nr:FkbM family methyltransferase [Clostridia bacterium]
MYGMGNGADKILAVLSGYGIEVSDFFASDGFVRGHSFHGKTVLSYSQVKEKYDDLIVLLSFASSRPEVIELIKTVASEYELYAPDVPVSGDTLLTLNFYNQNKDKFDLVRSLLADERSKEVFDKVIEYKITGALSPLFESECDPNEPFENILSPQSYKVVCDLGAYNGDTARQILSVNGNIERIYALEPDGRTFKKLSAYAETEPRILPLNVGAWDKKETLAFSDQGNRNSGVGMGKGTADLAPLDCLVSDEVDYIKYDVEGSEKEALNGARNIILRDKPEMLVSLYHRSEDLFALPLQIHSLRPDYRFYLRRFPYIPAWDLNLYCI